jgi:hypothetical protein
MSGGHDLAWMAGLRSAQAGAGHSGKGRRLVREALVDPQLSMLTVAEAAEFRALVHDAFANAGRTVALGPHNAHDDSGRRYGLWNLASACHDAAEAGDKASWPAMIAAHVRRVTSIPDDVFEGLTPDSVRSRVYARLVPTESPHVERVSYAQQVVPGVSRILAFDMPETVASISDEEAERFGGVAALWEAGLANLRALPLENQQQVTLPDGGHFVGLTGDSVFTASRMRWSWRTCCGGWACPSMPGSAWWWPCRTGGPWLYGRSQADPQRPCSRLATWRASRRCPSPARGDRSRRMPTGGATGDGHSSARPVVPAGASPLWCRAS